MVLVEYVLLSSHQFSEPREGLNYLNADSQSNLAVEDICCHQNPVFGESEREFSVPTPTRT